MASITVTTGDRSGGGRPSEDRIIVVPDAHAVIVLDGVSTLTSDKPLGGVYAQTLGEHIAARLPYTDHLDLRHALYQALETVSAGNQCEAPGTSPAATVAIVRHRSAAHMVDALVLADTPVVALRRDGHTEVITDDRLELLVTAADDHPEFLAQLRAGCGFASEQHQTMVHRLRDHQLRYINAALDPDAYWVAESLPEAAWHAVVRSWTAAELDRLLVMTDGVSTGALAYGLWDTWAQVAEACAASEGPQGVVDALHQYEESEDPDGSRHPRYKRHDDKALACVTINRERR